MHSSALQTLFRRGEIWRGKPRSSGAPRGRPTGFEALDRALHQGGWPEAGLTELLCRTPFPAALHLLLPALARCSREGPVFLVNPPLTPFGPALESAGLLLSRVRVLRGAHLHTLLRAAREAAASEAVTALVLWLPAGRADPAVLRRLHRAACRGRCQLALVHPLEGAEASSPAPLRIGLEDRPAGDLCLTLRKQPGGRAGQRLCLSVLPSYLRRPLPPVAELAPPATMRSTLPHRHNQTRPELPPPVPATPMAPDTGSAPLPIAPLSRPAVPSPQQPAASANRQHRDPVPATGSEPASAPASTEVLHE